MSVRLSISFVCLRAIDFIQGSIGARQGSACPRVRRWRKNTQRRTDSDIEPLSSYVKSELVDLEARSQRVVVVGSIAEELDQGPGRRPFDPSAMSEVEGSNADQISELSLPAGRQEL
jgi:hypothetical protein